MSIPIERGTCSTAVCRRAERAGSNAFTRRPLAQFSRRIEPTRVVGLFDAPFQLFAHHQLRPPTTPPFVEPPCSAFRRSRSGQRSSICRRPGVSSQVTTGTAHQTKEARRVESASFLRGYARGALGAIRDCREDTARLLRKCGARQREPAGLPSSVRNVSGHREFIRNLSPTGAWNDGPSFHPRGCCMTFQLVG